MNTRDFNQMTEILLASPWHGDPNFGLNSTPLNHALLYMADYVGKFIMKNNVEKMNLVVLTDGESNTLCHYDYTKKNIAGIRNGPTYINSENGALKVNAKTFLRDPITRKEYAFNDVAPDQTSALMNLIKDRYNLHTVGFFVTSSQIKSIDKFVYSNYGNSIQNRNTAMQRSTEIQHDLRKHKSLILKDVPGRDELYLILSTNKINDESLDDITNDMSAAQISKQLSRMFTTRKTSRVVLNSFIGVVA
jgi:hypothetical protein